MRGLWEEVEALTLLPPITKINQEIATYINATHKHQEEQKLFQFLNGLEEVYWPQRSQILLMRPLPSVDEACNLMQQEESQRDIFKQQVKEESGGLAMLGKKLDLSCSNCGKGGHTQEKCWACKVCGKTGHSVEDCWHIKDFPAKFEKSKGKVINNRSQPNRNGESGTKDQNFRGNYRGDKNKQVGKKIAGNVKVESEGPSGSENNTSITAQQLEQLLKLLPSLSKNGGGDGDDDLEGSYSGMVTCNLVNAEKKEWIIDCGATHHMSSCEEALYDVKSVTSNSCINLPTGESSKITGFGREVLDNGLNLGKVMMIPKFRHNLLSVQKLCKENDCKVVFHPQYCLILDNSSSEIRGIGRAKNGLYYLIELPPKQAVKKLVSEANKMVINQKENRMKGAMSAEADLKIPSKVDGNQEVSKTTLWHRRMGHAPRPEADLDTVQDSESQSEEGQEENISSTPTETTVRRSTRPHNRPVWQKDYFMSNCVDNNSPAK
ncbi:Retrovirus-related Pol polyprotein from transposon RE2, partial [Bienertia sinuspersici]